MHNRANLEQPRKKSECLNLNVMIAVDRLDSPLRWTIDSCCSPTNTVSQPCSCSEKQNAWLNTSESRTPHSCSFWVCVFLQCDRIKCVCICLVSGMFWTQAEGRSDISYIDVFGRSRVVCGGLRAVTPSTSPQCTTAGKPLRYTHLHHGTNTRINPITGIHMCLKPLCRNHIM